MKKENVFIIFFAVVLISSASLYQEFITEGSNLETGNRNQIGEGPIERNYSSASHFGTKAGILDPLIMEYSGWQTSGTLDARTDTGTNLVYDLPLDATHDWVGSKVEVDVWNLSRYYVVNGTFNEGSEGTNVNPSGNVSYYPLGWDSSSYSSEIGQTQRSSYTESGRKYVAVENEGITKPEFLGDYRHYAGTNVTWNQNISRVPYAENFYLSFDLQYFRGPLGENVTGNCSVFVEINGTQVWNHSLLVLQERGVWYSMENIPIQVPEPGDTVEFAIGLSIDEEMTLDPETDGGLENTAYITVFLDDLIFEGQKAPGLEQVGMSLSVDNTTVYFANTTGSGHAEIVNENYWTTSPVTSLLDANTSVGFEYETRLLTHRFINSSWTTDEDAFGVHYDTAFNEPVHLEMFTYLGFLGEYENLTIETEHPYDWTNTTVYDPFGENVTSLCTIGDDYVIVNSSLTSRLGWWKMILDAPNYLYASMVQVYDDSQEKWINETQLRSHNSTRMKAIMGTDIEVAATLELVNMSWVSSNGSVWFYESLSDGSSGEINGSVLVFGRTNATAGEWYTLIEWSNGTEVAYGGPDFAVYHETNLTALDEVIDTEAGLAVRARVQFRDSENGEYLIDPAASVVGNWTDGSIEFQPNAVNNWWEYEIDTSGLTGGNYTIVVNASLDYFDNSSTLLVLRVFQTDNTLTLKQDVAELDLGESFTAVLHYEDSLGVGIDGAQLSVRFSGPSEGINWSAPVDHGSGNYTLDFSTFLSGSYTVTIMAQADFYEAAEDVLFIYVGEIGTELIILNGSTGAIDYGEDYRLVVEYRNITGYGLEGATVSVASISPETGLEVTEINPLEEGFYEILFTSTKADTYTLLIEANLTNHKTQFESFTLSVSEISTVLTLEASDDVITIDESCFIELTLLNSTDDGVEGASVALIDPPDELVLSDTSDLGGGSYAITVSSNVTGIYQLIFRASLENHIDSTTSFTLSIVLVPTRLYTDNQELDPIVEYGDSWTPRFYYQRLDDSGNAYANISGADVVFQVISGPESKMRMTMTECEECFSLRIWTTDTGTWDIRVLANKTGFLEADIDIRLSVVPVSTTINSIDDFQCYLLCPISFLVNYSYASNGTVISEAEIRASGTGSDWVTIQTLASGLHSVTLIAEETGAYVVEIQFSSEGHETQSVSLDFTAVLQPLSINVDTIVWRQGSDLVLTVTITDTEDGTAIPGADVEYVLIQNDNEISSGTLDYSDTGVYSTTVAITWRDTDNLQVEFTVRKQYYETTSTRVGVVTQPDVYAYLSGVAMTVLPIGLVMFVALGIVSAAYNKYRQRQSEHLQETRKVKRRFDDAANLLGIIVLHKSSGLPIYSKILKSGLEEGMVSAFITAITHFRSEFKMSEHTVEGHVIPISDIIRAVPTRNLICAFITITSPSRAQQIRMEAFAAAIGERYDERFVDAPKQFREERTASQIDEFFDKFLDGRLLRKYTLKETAELGDKYKPVVNHAQELNGEKSFSLYQLAQLVMDDDILEAEAYYRILELVKDELLLSESSRGETTYFNDVG